MLILFILFILLLCCALWLLFRPAFHAHHNLLPGRNIILSLITVAFTLSFYLFFSHPLALNEWLKYGQKHYQLLVEYEQLGGIDGIIFKIKQKLAKNPNDRQGWLILGKLYEYKQDKDAAKKAFYKAQQ